MRVYPEFLKNLPGVQASDSMGYRIEALRVYLEGQLGEEAFIAAYQHLNNLENDEDENDEVENNGEFAGSGFSTDGKTSNICKGNSCSKCVACNMEG